MSTIFRPARPDDLKAGARVVQQALNDLRLRHGLTGMQSPPPTQFPAFCLARDPEGLWVAEDDGAIIGWCFSLMHQQFWFLSQLDVVPDAQGRGIGQTLMNHALVWSRQRGTDNRALITFAFNVHSIGLYARNGLHARVPLYQMSAPADLVARRIAAETGETYNVRLRSDVPNVQELIGKIDVEVLGFRRDAYHDFLCQGAPAEAMLLFRDSEPVGYCYITVSGHIGPLAITPGADGRQAVRAVIARALNTHPPMVSMIVPGPSDVLMCAAGDSGFRIAEPLLLMAERAFGQWHSYMPRSPGHM
jgi:GNAT superfamily N-acetyltransferase